MKPTIAEIQAATCAHFALPRDAMTTNARHRRYTRPRMVAVHLSKRMTDMSLSQIGAKFGRRDHSTIHNAVERIDLLRATDDVLDRDVRSIRLAVEASLRAKHGGCGDGVSGD